MALPKLNSDYIHETIIPSTGQSVRFRPYLVKEEKVLLMAVESAREDIKVGKMNTDIAVAMRNVIDNCFEGVNAESLKIYDIEYLFTTLRAKSAGEIAHLSYKCQHCETENEIDVDLEDINVSPAPESNLIKIRDDITLEMEYPTFGDTFKNPGLFSEKSVKNLTALLSMMIKSVMTQDQVIDFRSEPEEDRITFIESLTKAQMEEIIDWISDSPKSYIDIDFTCFNCGKENSAVLSGIQNFFT